jgi:hypothetical protein
VLANLSATTAAKTTPGLKPAAAQLAVFYQKAIATRRANQKAKEAQATAAAAE